MPSRPADTPNTSADSARLAAATDDSRRVTRFASQLLPTSDPPRARARATSASWIGASERARPAMAASRAEAPGGRGRSGGIPFSESSKVTDISWEGSSPLNVAIASATGESLLGESLLGPVSASSRSRSRSPSDVRVNAQRGVCPKTCPRPSLSSVTKKDVASCSTSAFSPASNPALVSLLPPSSSIEQARNTNATPKHPCRMFDLNQLRVVFRIANSCFFTTGAVASPAMMVGTPRASALRRRLIAPSCLPVGLGPSAAAGRPVRRPRAPVMERNRPSLEFRDRTCD